MKARLWLSPLLRRLRLDFGEDDATLVFAGDVTVCAVVACSACAQGTKLWTCRGTTRWSAGRRMGWRSAAMGGWRRGRRLPCCTRRAGIMCGRWRRTLSAMRMWAWAARPPVGAVVMRVCGRMARQRRFSRAKNLGVQALRLGADGQVYAATSPDGKVYRLGAADRRMRCGGFRSGADGGEAEVSVGCGSGAGAGVRVEICLWRRARRRWCIGCRRVGGRRRLRSRRSTSISGAC